MQGFQRPNYQSKPLNQQQSQLDVQQQQYQSAQQQPTMQQHYQPMQQQQYQATQQQHYQPMQQYQSTQQQQPMQQHSEPMQQQQPIQNFMYPQAEAQGLAPTPQYQINAATYSAYPEHNPEFIQKGISYQYGSVEKGWNDPPVRSNNSLPVMPKSEMVGKLSGIMARVKQNSAPQKQRMIDDTERRIDSFLDLLGSFENENCLGGVTAVLQALDAKDFLKAKSLITDLMVKFQDQSKWLLGLKRMIELLELC